MKRSYFYIIFLASLSGFISCKNSKNDLVEKQIAHEIRVYHQSMKTDDELSAIQAMQSLLAWDSTKTQYYDTLAILFFHTQNYLGAVHCAKMELDKHPDNADMLVLSGNSYQALRRFDLAIPAYSKLMQVKPNIILNYELAKCYYYIQDHESATRYINIMLTDKSSDSTKVNISYNNERDHQDVPLKAAAYNLLGSLKMGQEKQNEALENFQNALKVYKDFELAKQNIEIVKKGIK